MARLVKECSSELARRQAVAVEMKPALAASATPKKKRSADEAGLALSRLGIPVHSLMSASNIVFVLSSSSVACAADKTQPVGKPKKARK
jgi:hypothetical protein